MAELSYVKLDQWIDDYIKRINTYKTKIKVNRSKIRQRGNNILLKKGLLQVIEAYKEIIDADIDEPNDKNDKLTKIEYLKENIMQGNVSNANKELHSPYWYLKNEDSLNYASPEIINGMWTNFKQTIAWLDYLEKDFP